MLILLASAAESRQEQTGESNADDAAWYDNVRALWNRHNPCQWKY